MFPAHAGSTGGRSPTIWTQWHQDAPAGHARQHNDHADNTQESTRSLHRAVATTSFCYSVCVLAGTTGVGQCACCLVPFHGKPLRTVGLLAVPRVRRVTRGNFGSRLCTESRRLCARSVNAIPYSVVSLVRLGAFDCSAKSALVTPRGALATICTREPVVEAC